MEQDTPLHRQAAARAAHHAAVYHLLQASAARTPALGVEGAIGRAQFHYDRNRDAAALLAEMNLAILRLRQALLAGAESACNDERAAIARLADAWLYHAPLSHAAAFFPEDGTA